MEDKLSHIPKVAHLWGTNSELFSTRISFLSAAVIDYPDESTLGEKVLILAYTPKRK